MGRKSGITRRYGTRKAAVLAAAGVLLALGLAAAAAGAAAPGAADAPAGQAVTWQMIGPGGGGWIEALAWDPQDADTLYVGCDVGGFYVSHDGGRSYRIRNSGLRNYFVESIAVHPRDPNVILLGTQGGIFRTTNRGETWSWVRVGFPPVQRWSFSAPVGAVAFHPSDADVAYAGIGRPRGWHDGQGAVYRSEDAGLSWRNVSEGRLPGDAIVADIELHGSLVLVATDKGVFRSEDGGRTWAPSSDGLPHLHCEELALAESDPDVVYVSLRTTARQGEQWNGGVYRSDDAGRTWRSANGAGMPTALGRRDQPYPMNSGVKEIAVDPRNADSVYVGSSAWVSDGVYRSQDGGATWERVAARSQGVSDYGWIREWGLTVTCMALSPADPGRLAVGTSGHVFVTEDAGVTWQQRYCRQLPDGRVSGTGLEVTCLNNVLPDPVRPDRLYLCYFDIGLLVSDDGGRAFRRCHEGMRHEGNCFTVVVDPEAPDTLWAATGQWSTNVGDLCQSDDDGESWRMVGRPETGLPNGQVKALLLDPTSPAEARRLLATSRGHGVYESTDGGLSWRSLNGNLPTEAARSPRGLLLDPADAAHLVLALAGKPEEGGGVYETRDGGKTWQRLNADTPFPDIWGLTADPRDFATVYAAVRFYYDHDEERGYPGGAFRSTDGGRTWSMILDYHYVEAVAVSPADSRVIYAATNDHPFHDDYVAEGILRSEDAGLTWRHENSGLSHLNVNCLAVSPHDPSALYVGTGGNSAFVGRDQGVQ